MATYTIGVTAFEYSEADNVENPEKAYDNSASTYATVDMDDANEYVYLYAFNFSKIPQGEVVTSITAKVKSCGSCDLGDCLVWLQSTADSSGVKLSADMTPATSVSTKTLSLTADVSTIMSYANTLSVAFSHDGLDATFDIYAVYFTVTTSVVKPNKVIYGNETLIDLTSDTATASDVVSGKTFHLANGVQETGSMISCPIETIEYDYNIGYISAGTWTYENPTRTYTDIYEVKSGHRYFITLGANVGTRFRAMFTTTDIRTVTGGSVTGTQIINLNNPASYRNASYTATADGYILVAKDNVGKTGVITYVYDATEGWL